MRGGSAPPLRCVVCDTPMDDDLVLLCEACTVKLEAWVAEHRSDRD